ncbi:DNA-binding protein WhiA [Anaerococcus sp. AGMB00486]|uniref:Probable cell division protein WhiA n=1 Tax=Anaerococcus faecalis TaxID=2742993 RepID=A0ABX2N8Q4_9FIRM|nr:DNA-binding protein WhiA [Anaerococcus faecalis]NVF11049.1 DNA-binding protein WhiA [Anaerococcus faecalis]
MSFSKRCKKEILKKEPETSQIDVELLAYLYFSGSIRIRNNSYKILFKASENIEARYIYKIIKAKYDYSPAIEIQNKRKFSKDRSYVVIVEDSYIADLILDLADYYQIFDLEKFLKKIKTQKEKKIILKLAFLLKGSINDPYRGYNLEINLSDKNEVYLIEKLMKDFNIDAKINKRNDNYSVYIKDSDKISDFLAIIGANKSLFDLENVRVIKSIRNDINRQNNFDKANIDRTIKASFKQVEAINKLKRNKIFDNLSKELKELADLRVEYPYISIEELGKMANPPLSKAKVNYRLQKFIKLAESDNNDE